LRLDDDYSGVALGKIEMKCIEQCEEQRDYLKYSGFGYSRYYGCFLVK